MWTEYLLSGLVILVPLFGWLLWNWNEFRYVLPLKWRSSSLNAEVPPGQMGLPLVGQTFSFWWNFNVRGRPDDFINAKKQKYGENVGAYRSHLFGSPSIIACSPSLCKFVLHSTDSFKEEWPTTEALGANALITMSGVRHDLIKSYMIPAINRPEPLGRIMRLAQPNIIAGLDSLSKRGNFEAEYELKKVIFGYTAMHYAHLDFGSRIDEILKLFTDVAEGFRAEAWNFPGTTYHHALKCRKKLTNILREELERRRINKIGKTTDHGDLMDGLMELKDKEGNHITDEQILDNVFNSMHISHAAIANMIAWSLYFLAKSPHALQELRDENMAMQKVKQGEYITYEDVSKLKYTKKVVEESIRLTSSSGIIFRTATEDVEYKGYMIPKGWNVILWLRYLHTDPENFEDPLSFNPDRWNTPAKHGTFLPFGGGTRSCPGSTLARVSLTMFLHYMAVGYKWELLNPDAAIRYLSHPHPVDGFQMSISKI